MTFFTVIDKLTGRSYGRFFKEFNAAKRADQFGKSVNIVKVHSRVENGHTQWNRTIIGK